MTISANNMRGLELLNNRPSTGSLSKTDQFSTDELHRFLMNTYNIQESVTNGSERFPGELLRPEKLNLIIPNELLNLLVEYYEVSYETMSFQKAFTENFNNSIVLRNRADQYGRCWIGSEIFDSVMSSRNIKGSFILAQFVNQDRSVDLYLGQVQYFFTHSVNLPNQAAEHKLAYIHWFKTVNLAKIWFYFSIRDQAETCNVKLWSTEFYPIKRECIIPIYNIFDQFVPFRYRISNRQNSRKYLAVIPINRKYNI